MQFSNLFSKNRWIMAKVSMHSVRWCSKLIERIGPHNKAPVMKFMHEHFVNDEPLSNSLKIMKTRKDVNLGWDNYFSTVLDEKMSFKCEQSGIITGVALCAVKNINKRFEEIVTHDAQFKKILEFLVMIESNCDIYKTFQVNQYFYIDCFGVHRDHRKNGLIFLLINHIEALARQVGCKVLIAITTNTFATLGASRVGMKPIYSLKYEDYKINGEMVFKIEKPHTHVNVVAKYI